MKLEEELDGLKDPYMTDENYSHSNQLQGSRQQHDLPVWISTLTYQENKLPFEPFILGVEKQQRKYMKEELIYVRIILSHWTAEFIIKKDRICATLSQLESVFLSFSAFH